MLARLDRDSQATARRTSGPGRRPHRVQPRLAASRSWRAPHAATRLLQRLPLSVLLLAAASPAAATSVAHRNLGELIALSQSIVVADVASVRDGFDGGLPFTEIDLEVDESIRGGATGRLSFRQFGLLEPRSLPDGRISYLVSPPGWPRFRPGERVLLFLYRPAPESGLRTTVGLFQGKFTVEGRFTRNPLDNAGLFDGLDLPASAGPAAHRLVQRRRGPVPTKDLLDFVRQAVREEWFD